MKKEFVPSDKWIWYGHAGHLCVGHYCRFHLCTKVGQFFISTVGDYFPPGEDARDTIGGGEKDFFETYVFTAKKGLKCKLNKCQCGMPNIDLHEIDGARVETAREAANLHMKMCRKYAKRKV